MKKKLFTKTTIIAIAAIIIIGIVNAQDKPRIMVLDFDAGAGITQSEVALLTTILTVYLQEEFEVLNLEETDRIIDEIINELGFQRETMTMRQMEMVDNLLNVSKIIAGNINIRRGQYRIHATSVDAETSTIETTIGETGDRFHRVAQQVAQNLIAEIKRSEVPVPQEVAVETLLEFDAANRGVLINGVRWATSNVDVQVGTFVSSPEMAGRFNAWGVQTDWGVLGTRALNPFTGAERSNWGHRRVRNESGLGPVYFVLFDDGTENYFGENRGEDLHEPLLSQSVSPRIGDFVFENTTYWINNDPCPPGWRIPYVDEFESLVASGSFWTTVNGVRGRVFGTAPNQIFLPAAGGGGIDPTMNHIPTHVAHAGQIGYYWTRNRQNPETAWRFWFSQVDANIDIGGDRNNIRFGYSVRCVAQTDNIYVEF